MARFKVGDVITSKYYPQLKARIVEVWDKGAYPTYLYDEIAPNAASRITSSIEIVDMSAEYDPDFIVAKEVEGWINE